MIKKVHYLYHEDILLSEECSSLAGGMVEDNIYSKKLLEISYTHLRSFINPIMLDIGAHFGQFSMLPKYIDDLTVFAFEPLYEAFQALQANLKLNEIDPKRVHTFNKAISSELGSQDMLCSLGRTSMMSTLAERNNRMKGERQTRKVETTTVDIFVKLRQIPQIDFIKIDVEGAELYVLQGAHQTIEKFKPIILVEIDNRNTSLFGYKGNEILKVLENFGYNHQYVTKHDVLCSWERKNG